MSNRTLPQTMSGSCWSGTADSISCTSAGLAAAASRAGRGVDQGRCRRQNNTDINTRIGWYSKGVTGQTNSGAAQGFAEAIDDDASWSGIPLQFPAHPGADCCGEDCCRRHRCGSGAHRRTRLGAQHAGNRLALPTSSPALPMVRVRWRLCPVLHRAVDRGLSHRQCAQRCRAGLIPCAYSTAENMLERAA